jgi:hypothetical protein
MGTLKATDELLPTTRRMRSHCWISCGGCLSEQDSAPSAHPLIVLDRLEWQELAVVDSTVEHQDPTTHNNDIGGIISGSNCYLLQKWRRLLWWPSPAIPTRQDSMSRAVQIGCFSPIGGDHHSLIRKVKLCLSEVVFAVWIGMGTRMTRGQGDGGEHSGQSPGSLCRIFGGNSPSIMLDE